MDPWLEAFAQANFLRSADTAHDLKTPLNVAVLNLELMRMRLRKFAEVADDEKITNYAASIELELRRMARIFDAFFLLSTPPKNEGDPAAFDVCAICGEAATTAGYELQLGDAARVVAHESRLRQAFKMFFEGASRVLKEAGRAAASSRDTHIRLTISGEPSIEDLELTKIFKFYYTDASGNPDLSFATARLIVETYGGEVTAEAEEDGRRVALTIALPLVLD